MSQQINLYNPALLKRRELLSAANLAMVTALLLLAMAGASGVVRVKTSRLETEVTVLSTRLKAEQDQMAALGREISGRKPDVRLESELKTVGELLMTRQKAMELLGHSLGPSSVGFAEYLSGLARQTPAGIWLTSFAVAVDGSGMEIRGRTNDPALLPDYIQRLNGEKAFKGRSFAAMQLQAGKAETTGTPGAAVTSPPFHEFALIPRQKLAEEGRTALSNAGEPRS
ncbi:PilN domain-containing protein [Denitratisoma oestradiolicum]|uniref:MSHA biogenesis protein MshI n=1 Tax=Denitratisoma oestradiolicum TaxID=311182 RepID=A0A6S6XSA5_9PROT|nr:PilN domain-containing protein [Denitratisoma oestradiolicum]TWO80535.1 hypothetical protein CBW56_08835 [Denitratisoma oestradiolicum]CAB1367605.1 conserved protein of unknown function [Denitratisoma oestradiolicum]